MPTGNEYSDIRFDGSQSAEGQDSNLGTGGDYAFAAYAPATTDVMAGTYPNLAGPNPENRQFSSDKESDPIRLMEQTRAGIEAHASLNESYGLFQPVATLGSHPWLRDSLAVPSEG